MRTETPINVLLGLKFYPKSYTPKHAVTSMTMGSNVVDLRPGLYKVTFTIQGFSTFIQDGIELPSNFTATVNADLKVGAVEETLTVSGQAPVVDVQNGSVPRC